MGAMCDLKFETSPKYFVLYNFLSSLFLLIILYITTGEPQFKYFCLNLHSLYVTKAFMVFLFFTAVVRCLLFGRGTRSVQGILKISSVFKSLAILILSVILFHVIAVLYGAPILESFNETFHLASLLTVSITLPCLAALGTDTDKWTSLISEFRIETYLDCVTYATAICSIIGAWIGAFPIPLDWDRPWQVWPITCVVGTVLGHVVGLVLASIYILYQYKQRRKTKII